jgi:hypothetical protein
MIAYLAILASTISGLAGLGLWSVTLTALALFSLSQSEYGSVYKRANSLGHGDALYATVAQSAFNAVAATSAGYAFGWLLKLI